MQGKFNSKLLAIGVSLTLCSAAAQADPRFDNCQRPVVGETWDVGSSQCLLTDNFALLYERFYTQDNPLPSLSIDAFDGNSISLSTDIDVSSPGGGGGAKNFGGSLIVIVADGYELESSLNRVIGTQHLREGSNLSTTPTVDEVIPTVQNISNVKHVQPMSEIIGPGTANYFSINRSSFFAAWSYRTQYQDGPGVWVYKNSDTHYDKMLLGVVVGAIPEPSTWAMMALGLLGVAASVRRQRR